MDGTLFAKLFKKNLDGVVPMLVKISHPDITTLYLTDNNESLVYLGDTYVPAYFTIALAEQSENADGEASFVIGCVDRQITDIIRSVDYLNIEFVAEYYDGANFSTLDGYAMKLKDISWDSIKASGSLYWDNVLPLSFGGEFTATTTSGIV